MKGLKTNIKRPWIHYIIIIAYITAPLANILLLVLIAKLPLATIVHRLFKGYGLLAGLWLLTAPLVGIGLYFIHRISWYIFLGHSSLILIDYILKWAKKSVFYWRTVPTFHQFLLLTGNGEVMHRTPGGYRIRFMSLPAVEGRDIRLMLKTHFTLRHEIELPGGWIFDGKIIDGQVK